MTADPDECQNCYHDRSWHIPECQECINDPGSQIRCAEFEE